MESYQKNACFYENHVYPDGYRLHSYFRDMVCKEGKWHERDEKSIDSKVSLAYTYH
ncbi:MAG: hypothetical protein AB9873_16325 [Syntrophobacteraceae bacterium]